MKQSSVRRAVPTALLAVAVAASASSAASIQSLMPTQISAQTPIKMYDGMPSTELRKLLKKDDAWRWNYDEYGDIPADLQTPNASCVNAAGFGLKDFAFAKQVSWSFGGTQKIAPLPVSFSCEPTRRQLHLRLATLKMRKNGSTGYINGRRFRSLPIRAARSSNNHVYLQSKLTVPKWSAYNFLSGYQFTSEVADLNARAQAEKKLDVAFGFGRALFAFDEELCVLTDLDFTNRVLVTYIGSTARGSEACDEAHAKIAESPEPSMLPGFGRVIERRLDNKAYDVQFVNSFTTWQMTPRIQEMFSYFISQLTSSANTEPAPLVLKRRSCQLTTTHAQPSSDFDKLAKRAAPAIGNMAKAACIAEVSKPGWDARLTHGFIQPIFYYAQAGQSPDGQQCFLPEVYYVGGNTTRSVKASPSAVAFCASADDLRLKLQQQAEAITSRYGSKFHIQPLLFFPVAFLKSDLRSQPSVIFPESAALGHRRTLSTKAK